MLDRITPLVLTYNEEANVDRTLARLAWARSVVVLDSFSTDATLTIARSFPNVTVVQRAFDDFAGQLNYALDRAPISTEWVLVLDADYVLTEDLIAELRREHPGPDVAGYRCRFRYCIDGSPLRGSLYPPAIVLFRRSAGAYANDGHAYRVRLDGRKVLDLKAPIHHDDRKPITRWFASQKRYATEEAKKLRTCTWSELGWPDRCRKVPFLAPLLVLPYCLLVNGCILDGRAGCIYAAQRALAELLISITFVGARPNG